MIDVSIIIPIYNRESTLGYCLDSVANIRYKNYEIILIDDGSTDGSATYARNFVKLILKLNIIIKKMAVYRRHVIWV